jgi:hypothetical protein
VVAVAVSDVSREFGIGVHLGGMPPLGDYLDDRSEVLECVRSSERVHEFEDERPHILGRQVVHPQESLWHDIDHQGPGRLVVPHQGHEHLRGGRNHGAVLLRLGGSGQGEIPGVAPSQT